MSPDIAQCPEGDSWAPCEDPSLSRRQLSTAECPGPRRALCFPTYHVTPSKSRGLEPQFLQLSKGQSWPCLPGLPWGELNTIPQRAGTSRHTSTFPAMRNENFGKTLLGERGARSA